MTQTPDRSLQLTKHQLDLIEQFEIDYNDIDRFLKSALNLPKENAFSAAVRSYARSNPRWVHVDLLLDVAELRNLLIHGKTARGFPAVPTPALAQELHACREALLNPERVIPRFQRAVKTVAPNDSLATVLHLVQAYNYSQFPVYDDKKFRGLLTENGITRWLAAHLSTDLTLVEFEDAKVSAALRQEEEPKNCAFIGRKASVDELRALFYRDVDLEAVLITDTGKRSETPLGIASRSEIAGLA